MEAKKGEQGGESRLVPASSPLPFLASLPGHGGAQHCPHQKLVCFFRSKNKGTLECACQEPGLEGKKKGKRQTRVLVTDLVGLKRTPIPQEGGSW